MDYIQHIYLLMIIILINYIVSWGLTGPPDTWRYCTIMTFQLQADGHKVTKTRSELELSCKLYIKPHPISAP